MCGIIGVIGTNYSRDKFLAARDTMNHRGPDDGGVYFDESQKVSLGQRRLSIIDLSVDGHQPFLSQDGRYVLVFNGEIYNYIELKKELELSYTFHTRTDTEVLLAAYIVWGKKCLNKLNGMFAFAIWDKKEQMLFCARDHVGIKPFFYHFKNGIFSFASEIKALLSFGIDRKENEKIIFDYLRFGFYDHSNETFFNDIFSLSSGSFLTIKNGQIQIEKYWDIAENQEDYSRWEEKDIKEYFKYLLVDSIRMQFRSDVPVGINLSSGLDSNSLLYFSQKLGFNVQTFSMCLPDDEYNECRLIEPVLSLNQKKNWHKVFLTPEDVFKLAQNVNKIQDQPFGGIPTIAYSVLCKKTQEVGTVVLLEGQGIDEILAGYDYYKIELKKDLFKQNSVESSVSYSQDLTKLSQGEFLSKSFHDQFLNNKLVFDEPFDSHLLNAQYRDFRYTKLPRVLRFNDHMTMAYSRELRVPFLDYRIAQFCFHLPAKYKINEFGSKALMREIMDDVIPDVLRIKSKKAFGAVQTPWLRKYFREEVMNILSSESFLSRKFYNYEELMKKVEKFYSGEGDNSFFLWQVINLEFWFREYID